MTHLSLFSGIGGLDLAAEWVGFKSVGQCEWADYPTKVLEKHWPNVPRWRDIRTLTKESFYERTGLHTVNIISGGFPCQPFSVAGNQKGEDDDRYLWPEMLRVISEIKPTWVFGENVANLTNMVEFEYVCTGLESQGYEVQPIIIPACAVGANHIRKRVFIVAHSNGVRKLQQKGRIEEFGKRISNGSQDMAYAPSVYVEGFNNGPGEAQSWGGSWWETEPNLGRVADGIPDRMDRLKCLGNAVVPQQAYPIFKAIAEIELGN